MKKIIILLIATLVLFSIRGCNKAEKKVEIKNVEESTEEKIAEIEEGEYEFTNDDVTTIFENNRKINNYDINDYEILDSILVNDKSNTIKAIILFNDKKTNNSCNLAFIVENMDKENVVQEITFAVNEVEGIRDFEISDGGHLTYKENGEVTLSIREIKTNEVFDITIIYSRQEPNETNFKLISNKHIE